MKTVSKRFLSLTLMLVIALSSAITLSVSAEETELAGTGAYVPAFTNIEVIDHGIKFKWNKYVNSSYPDGVFYRVYYKSSNGWVRMITTAATQYIDTDVHVGKTFTYTLRCVTPAGQFASDYNKTGWKVSYYDMPVFTSVISKVKETAPTGEAVIEPEPPTAVIEATEKPTISDETTADATGANEEVALEEEQSIEEPEQVEEFTPVSDSIGTEGETGSPAEAPEGGIVTTDTIQWTSSAPAFRVWCKYQNEPDNWHVVCESTKDKSFIIENTANGIPYAYKVCALDNNGAVAGPCATTPYYSEGKIYCTRNRWIYELISSKISGFDNYDFTEYTYTELSNAAHTYGALTPAGYFNDGVSLTRQFAADTLVNLYKYKTHSLGNYYNTAGNSTVGFTKTSKANYYAADTTNKNMNTVGYYGWFSPDWVNKLYPKNNVNADEWDELMTELSLYRTWCGKTVISFGDSGMQGRGNIVNKNSGSLENSWRDVNRKDFANKRFARFNRELMEGPVEFVGEKYGMNHRDYSWSGAAMGTQLTKSGSNYSFVSDVSYKCHVANQVRTAVKEKQKADLIIMNGGDNDEYFSSIPYSSVSGTRMVYDWGYSASNWFSEPYHRNYHSVNKWFYNYNDKKVTEDYTKETSFVDGTMTAFSLIRQNYPDAPVIYVRSHQIEVGSLVRQRRYQEKILSIADSMGVYTVDLFNISELDGYNKPLVARYCYDGYTSSGAVDKRGIHPNGLGYSKCYLPYIEKVMNEL